MDWDILTQLRTTSHYCAIADLHILQITAANTKSSPVRSVFNGPFLATDVNSGDSSASCIQALPVHRISHNSTLSQFGPAGSGLLVILPRAGPKIKQHPQQLRAVT
jgi:hypothetical protein